MDILYDVLVKEENFIYLEDFEIVDCKVYLEMLIIQGRPFLSIGRVFVDKEWNELKFKLNNEEVNFDVCRSMQKPKDMKVILVIDIVVECKIVVYV